MCHRLKKEQYSAQASYDCGVWERSDLLKFAPGSRDIVSAILAIDL